MSYLNLFNLEGKVAVVTGGSGYLGSEIVKGFLDFGANVVVFDKVNNDKFVGLDESKFKLINCDLSDSKDINRCYNKVKKIFGGIDILVACAAYTGYAGTGRTDEMSDDVWEQGIKGTVGITFKAIREVIPFFRERKGGNIITFGSLYAWIAPDFRIYDNSNVSPPNYGCGKAACVQLTRHVASQFANENIRANSITPGSYPHPKSFSNERFMNCLSGRTMMGRIGYPEDLVGAAIYLASDASKYVTGANISVDGGQLSW